MIILLFTVLIRGDSAFPLLYGAGGERTVVVEVECAAF
jgi:hypothetical protein